MTSITPPAEYNLRRAASRDAPAIRRIIAQAHINPTGLNWRRFILAVDRQGQVIGCGQVKPHADGSLELASIAVLPAWQGKGIARLIIERLLQDYPGTLYLTCRAPLGALYRKFGFRTLTPAEMPPYFRRLSRIVNLLNRLGHQPDILLVMRRG